MSGSSALGPGGMKPTAITCWRCAVPSITAPWIRCLCGTNNDYGKCQNDRMLPFDTTSITVYGDYLPPEEAEEQEVPFRITYGYSKDKRPDLKQFVFSTLCVDRAVPLWGTPEDGNASDKTVNNT